MRPPPSVSSKYGRACLTIVLAALLHVPPAAWADDIDDLLGGGDDDLSALGIQEKISEADFKARVSKAIAEKDASAQRVQLLDLLPILIRQDDLVFMPREALAFVNALLEAVPPRDLEPFVKQLLVAGSNNPKFDPSAKAKLNLGIQLSLIAGGAAFTELHVLLRDFSSAIDLEWFLPALGRAGGSQALPILKSHRSDRAIIPLGNVQNIRRVPCAAVLGCAYAGDADAFETVLQWYEQDTIDLPRFAFYVSWALTTGQKPGYELLDYCRHRINQAERLLAHRGASALPDLIARAGRDLSISLTGFLTRHIETVPDDGLDAFAPMLAHPSHVVRQRVLSVLMRRGNEATQARAMETVRALAGSPHAADRLFSVESLVLYDTDVDARAIEQVADQESLAPVRARMLRLSEPRLGSW